MIKVNRVTKKFGGLKAVDDVSFEVRKGEVLGFLGPNGAGKSTTMRMVTGYLTPDRGSVEVDGNDVVAKPLAAKSLIGYLPENAPSYPEMTVEAFLLFVAGVRGMSGVQRCKAVDRVVEMCFLGSVRHQSIDTLSKGFRHRTCFAQSILHDPPVLILDEPTDGLDPNQKHEVRTLIRSMGESKAIIFSTHILEEVEAACTRAIIIDAGRVVANGSPGELKQRSKEANLLSIVLRLPAKIDPEAKLRELEKVREVEVVSKRDSLLRLRVTPDRSDARRAGELAEEICELAARSNWRLRDLHIGEGQLDDVFRTITRPEIRAGKTETPTTTNTTNAEEAAKS